MLIWLCTTLELVRNVPIHPSSSEQSNTCLLSVTNLHLAEAKHRRGVNSHINPGITGPMGITSAFPFLHFLLSTVCYRKQPTSLWQDVVEVDLCSWDEGRRAAQNHSSSWLGTLPRLGASCCHPERWWEALRDDSPFCLGERVGADKLVCEDAAFFPGQLRKSRLCAWLSQQTSRQPWEANSIAPQTLVRPWRQLRWNQVSLLKMQEPFWAMTYCWAISWDPGWEVPAPVPQLYSQQPPTIITEHRHGAGRADHG